MWLSKKLSDRGNQPIPTFAFLGSVNWLRGLAYLCEESGFSNTELKELYRGTQRRSNNTDETSDILSFECLVMAMHNVSALDTISKNDDPYSLIRSAIISWYYATYYSSKAMIAASDGANPQTHAKTGKIWQTNLVERGLVQLPFNLCISNLIPSNIKTIIAQLRGDNNYNLNTKPENHEAALGSIYSYLNGTAEYQKEHLEDEVKSSSEYKSHGFTNFRTSAAKELRDKKLRTGKVNYLVQAFRYRGKANYRDAIYLSYGTDNTDTLAQLSTDLELVAKSFVLMASHYVSRRVTTDNWTAFVSDISQNAKFTLPFNLEEI